MAYQQSTKDAINQAYQDTFGRPASFGTLGGADYWADEMENKGLTLQGLLGHLQESAEGQSVTTDAQGNKTSWHGGVNPNQSIADTWAKDAAETDPLKKSWASHFAPGGALAGDLTGTIWEGYAGAGTSASNPTTKNVAGLLNASYNAQNPNSTLPSPYYQNDPITASTPIPGGTDDQTFGSGNTSGWWNQFADADAFKDFLKGDDDTATDNGMGDFMKFMMLMSVMKGGGGFGGGGYQGSQYGYGGLTPGGVQAAYDPMSFLNNAGTWFKNNFGSGSGGTTTDSASTATVNAT